jgi:hypothetical protein
MAGTPIYSWQIPKTEKPRRRVRCGGCNRRMYQNVPANRDYRGKSFHYDCIFPSSFSRVNVTRI